MSVFNSIQGTSLTTWRIGLTGPTVYSGTADPTISPPTPLADGFRDGDLYLRASGGASTIWVRDGGTFSAVSTAATGGDFDADVTMGASAQFLLDETAVAGAPAITFGGDSDTGIFQNNPDEISFSTGGIEKFIIEGNGTLASTTSGYEALVLADNDIPNRKYVEDTFLNTAGDTITGNLSFTGASRVLAADGSVGLPSMGFGNDLNTGFMLDSGLGIDSIGIVSGGAFVGDFTPDGLQMRNGAQVIGDIGSAGTPSLSFTGDLDTGIFSDGTVDQFGFSTGGVERWIVNSSGHYIPGAAATYDVGSTGVPVRNLYTDHTLAEFGAAGDPSYSWDGDDDTGMFHSGTNQIGFSTDGTERWVFRSNGDFEPILNNTYDIGASGLRILTVYATTFDGTATAAQYSDLAERYSVCKCCDVEPGTVMIICDHEDHEICASGKRADDRVIGVISTAPGLMMNKDAGNDGTHPYIALRGRVPVKVIGNVTKGDLLVTSDKSGHAQTANIDNKRFNHCAVFAKALSAGANGVVEAVIL